MNNKLLTALLIVTLLISVASLYFSFEVYYSVQTFSKNNNNSNSGNNNNGSNDQSSNTPTPITPNPNQGNPNQTPTQNQTPIPSASPTPYPTSTPTPTPQEQVAVQGASGTAGDAGATVYAQYIAGDNAIVINGALFHDASGGTVGGTVPASTTLPTTGALTTIVITAIGGLTSGHTYTVTLTSSKGGSFVSPSFVAP
jgi:cytoskeletal protein RodZ